MVQGPRRVELNSRPRRKTLAIWALGSTRAVVRAEVSTTPSRATAWGAFDDYFSGDTDRGMRQSNRLCFKQESLQT